MKDIMGNELQVGDTVVIAAGKCHGIMLVHIDHFGKRTVIMSERMADKYGKSKRVQRYPHCCAKLNEEV